MSLEFIYGVFFGLNIAEVLSMGKPVIATRCVGAEEQIVHEEHDLLAKHNNVKEMREAMQVVLPDSYMLRRLASNTKKYVTPIDAHADERLDFYSLSIEQRSKVRSVTKECNG